MCVIEKQVFIVVIVPPNRLAFDLLQQEVLCLSYWSTPALGPSNGYHWLEAKYLPQGKFRNTLNWGTITSLHILSIHYSQWSSHSTLYGRENMFWARQEIHSYQFWHIQFNLPFVNGRHLHICWVSGWHHHREFPHVIVWLAGWIPELT
jgi:hypothetical protein